MELERINIKAAMNKAIHNFNAFSHYDGERYTGIMAQSDPTHIWTTNELLALGIKPYIIMEN